MISICVCNYNMGSMLYEALSSVCEQLNNDFEVIVIDDGSTDNSLTELQRLNNKYEIFKFYSYPRDPNRSLGLTRNLSIKHASGKYVVLHIDADDVWENGISDWCYKAIKISEALNDEIFISGQQIQFVNKNFIKDFGGYRDIDYGEDRDLWSRLSHTNKLIFIKHKLFRKRMKLDNKTLFLKIFRTSWQILLFDLRSGESVISRFLPLLKDAVLHPFKRGKYGGLVRIIYMMPAFIYASFKGVYSDFLPVMSSEDSIKYKEKNSKTFNDWFNYLNLNN